MANRTSPDEDRVTRIGEPLSDDMIVQFISQNGGLDTVSVSTRFGLSVKETRKFLKSLETKGLLQSRKCNYRDTSVGGMVFRWYAAQDGGAGSQPFDGADGGDRSPEDIEQEKNRERRYQEWRNAIPLEPQTMPEGVEPSWIIRYADVDVPDEIFSGHGAEEAARRRFDQQRSHWSISLFKEVARG